jgi:hypothetical protein
MRFSFTGVHAHLQLQRSNITTPSCYSLPFTRTARQTTCSNHLFITGAYAYLQQVQGLDAAEQHASAGDPAADKQWQRCFVTP